MKSLYVLTPEEKVLMDQLVTQPAVLHCASADLVVLNVAHTVAMRIVEDLLKDVPADILPLFIDVFLGHGEGAIVVEDECPLEHPKIEQLFSH